MFEGGEEALACWSLTWLSIMQVQKYYGTNYSSDAVHSLSSIVVVSLQLYNLERRGGEEAKNFVRNAKSWHFRLTHALT